MENVPFFCYFMALNVMFLSGVSSTDYVQTRHKHRFAVPRSVILEYKSDPRPLILNEKDASGFLRRKTPSRMRRDLREECYSEGCSWEEVEEVVGGHALCQYYYGWRCRQAFGDKYTYSGNCGSSGQCSNILTYMVRCASGQIGMSPGHSRTCYFGHTKNIWGMYMENGCNDGELASFRLNFDDPGRSVRYVYNVGCREFKRISIVRGATRYTATQIGGGGGDRHVSNAALGWAGYNAKYCGNPGSPSNGYRQGSNFYETARVTFHCHGGFTLVGSSSRTCQGWGWDGSAPQCKRHCQPGYYSSTGYEPCTPCAVGYYQTRSNQRSCIQCPSGKITRGTGSRYASDCHFQCQEAVCTLQPWTTWSDMATPINGHCASQSRRQRYKKTWRTVIQSGGCSGLKQTCNNDIVATREKIIYCDPLVAPSIGRYEPLDCTTQRKRCKEFCMLTCKASQGLSLVGTTAQARRVCQPSGQWNDISAYCKDIQPPSITCPSDAIRSNDNGKHYATVQIPSPLSVNDNSGVIPAVTISPTHVGSTYNFPISDPKSDGTEITYTASDNAGLKASCSFYIKVKDVEKPKVISCPFNVTKESVDQETRVYWTTPVFRDNYKEKTPGVTSTTAPGATFNWGTRIVTYNATDAWGNMAQCQFPVIVKPPSCQLYDPPVHGVRTCNIKAGGATQEILCTVQCNDNYDFEKASPWYAYVCNNRGKWHGYRHFSFVPVPLPSNYGRPWPNCALKSPPKGVAKKVTVYSGSCTSNDQATRTQIQQKFLDTIQKDPFLMNLLCTSSQGKDCKLSNVKVYCGKDSRRRRRSLHTNVYVISFEIQINDQNPSSNEQEEKKILSQIAADLDGKKADIEKATKQGAAAATGTRQKDIEVEESSTGVSCPVGEQLVVKLDKKGTNIERSECVNCGVGTYYDMESQSCLMCKSGTYQDKEAQTSCKPCPSGTSTVGSHSSNYTDCKEICTAGHYSLTGLETCIVCPKGTYQPVNRSTSCITCPSGSGTLEDGVDSLEDCKKYCSPGEFAPQGMGACMPCRRGYYQPNSRSTNCIKCPDGTVTPDEGATSQNQCKANHWIKLNSAPVCFQGKNSKYGSFIPVVGGFVLSVKLTHVSGQINCGVINGQRAPYDSNWGCHNWPGLQATPLNVLLTDSSNAVLFPKTFQHPTGGWYSLSGYNSRSKDLVFPALANPLRISPQSTLRLWYGEDLKDSYESDNEGRVCADLYGFFSWVKLNPAAVCFGGKGDAFGTFKPMVDQYLLNVKLVHISGKIRCGTIRGQGAPYDSNWGCHNWPGLESTPLNTVITDSSNTIIFPKTVQRPDALWYGLDHHNARSQSLVFPFLDNPIHVSPQSSLRLWYGEDLKNWYEQDNVGRVCADVYGSLDWLKLNAAPVCFEGKNGLYGSFKPDIQAILLSVKLVHKSGKIRCGTIGGRGTPYDSNWGCHGWPGLEDKPLNTIITDGNNNIVLPKNVQHPQGLWYRLDGYNSRSPNLIFKLDNPLHVRPQSSYRIWYGEDLRGWYEGDNVGRICVDVYGAFS